MSFEVFAAKPARVESGYIYRRLGDGANQSSLPFLLKLTLLEWVTQSSG